VSARDPHASRALADDEVERIVPGTPAWDELYPEHIQRYDFVARYLLAGARVLDAGCGVGYGSAFLADRGAGSVVAVDISEEAIRTARARFSRERIRWVQDDCQTLEQVRAFAPFDLICNLENLEHLREPDRFLSRAAALMAPDGLLVTSTPNRIGVNRLRGVRADAPSVNRFHEHEYTAAEFLEMLSRHFEDVRLSAQTLAPVERMHFEPILSALWSNPAVRLGRWMQRAIRRRPVVEDLRDLLPPRRYQILDANPDPDLAITLLGECRQPRAGRR
jgi:2-polyprenyl-3-methyl-5-hydroxy-6-metoxy-1,4-benzoquinol methylase